MKTITMNQLLENFEALKTTSPETKQEKKAELTKTQLETLQQASQLRPKQTRTKN